MRTVTDIEDGESVQVQGSGSRSYTLKNVGGVYSCTCPAWRNQGVAIERRSCKHLKKFRGEAAEKERLGGDFTPGSAASSAKKNAPPLLLAESWDNYVDLTGWWMSEKLDGVRAYWTGTQFLSRQGNPFHAPDWFVEGLPSTALDGELWVGRQQFQRTVSIVRRQDKSPHWKELEYVVFDVPSHEGPFEERMQHLTELVQASGNAYVRALEQSICEGLDHVERALTRVEEQGGEGLMLRQPGSPYVAGRSSSLLKVKTFHDAEAVVVGYVPGKGRHKGSTGALEAELPDGTRFSVGTGLSDAERRNPPAIGTVMTFRYQELSNAGVPRFPSYLRGRSDVEWTGQPVKKKAKTSKKKAKAKAKTKTKAATQKTKAAIADADTRYFELTEGGSSKFWEITVNDGEHVVRYGRIGSEGQKRARRFDDRASAEASADKLVASKVAKGYVEVEA